MDLFAYLPQLNTILARHDVVLAYLFGSQARGEAGPLSDVDVAVLNRATPLLAWEVVRYGHRIYVSNPAARIDFETKPLRQMQQRRLAEWIKDAET